MTDGSVRSFLALEIPDRVRARIIERGEGLRRKFPPARWTRPEGWHLTLKFLGEVERRLIEDLATELRSCLRGAGTVTVRFDRTGFFPSPKRPRVAWIGGATTGAQDVVNAVERAAEKYGFARERRRWSVHVTLARLKSQWPATAVEEFLEWGKELEIDPFECREVVLFESDLQPGGAVYTALVRLPLE